MRRRPDRTHPILCAFMAIAVLAPGCGETGSEPVPLEVMAARTVDVDGKPAEARTFTVLEPIQIETHLRAAPGTFRFRVRFESTELDEAVVAVRVNGRSIGTCAMRAGPDWQRCAVDLPADVAAAPVLLAFDSPGRYSLASLDLDAGSGG